MTAINSESVTIRLDLTTAGTYQIDRSFEYLHVIRFEDSSGSPTLDGEISLSLNVSEDDYVPLLYNNKIMGKAQRARLRWTAQSGKWAVIVIAADARAFQLDTPNPRQLVTASGGTTLTAATVSVGTSATLLSASSSTRQSVTIQNLGTADVYVGPSGVTTSSGVKLASGDSITLDHTTAAIYGISGSAAQDCRVLSEAS